VLASRASSAFILCILASSTILHTARDADARPLTLSAVASAHGRLGGARQLCEQPVPAGAVAGANLPQLQHRAGRRGFQHSRHATESRIAPCRISVDRHIGTGHGAARVNTTLVRPEPPQSHLAPIGGSYHPPTRLNTNTLRAQEEIEAEPLWRAGDTETAGTEAGAREFRVAPPARLNSYQRSLVG
jgi:hypothetical protein